MYTTIKRTRERAAATEQRLDLVEVETGRARMTVPSNLVVKRRPDPDAPHPPSSHSTDLVEVSECLRSPSVGQEDGGVMHCTLHYIAVKRTAARKDTTDDCRASLASPR